MACFAHNSRCVCESLHFSLHLSPLSLVRHARCSLSLCLSYSFIYMYACVFVCVCVCFVRAATIITVYAFHCALPPPCAFSFVVFGFIHVFFCCRLRRTRTRACFQSTSHQTSEAAIRGTEEATSTRESEWGRERGEEEDLFPPPLHPTDPLPHRRRGYAKNTHTQNR